MRERERERERENPSIKLVQSLKTSPIVSTQLMNEKAEEEEEEEEEEEVEGAMLARVVCGLSLGH